MSWQYLLNPLMFLDVDSVQLSCANAKSQMSKDS